MNSNCFAIFFQQHSSYVCSDIYTPGHALYMGMHYTHVNMVVCMYTVDLT